MTTKPVPRAAMRFTVPVCEFGDNGANAKSAPVKMVARSGQPIEHWYWGNVVHDLAGMQLDKKSVPIDYCHDCDQILGYLNKFDITSGDLVVSGAVTPFSDGDRASEVLFKQKSGVPYEASINFGGDGIRVEQIGEGQVTQVNGYQFEGPGIVIREWPLRGVAICPYGADSNTSTEFKDSESPTINVNFLEESEMSKTNATEANPPVVKGTELTKEAPKGAVELAAEKKPAEGATPPVDAVKFDSAAYIAAFGDVGARWFLEGKSFAAAATEHSAAQKTEHESAITALKATHKTEVDALNAKVTELTEKLKTVKFGNDPVAFQASKETDTNATAKEEAKPNAFKGKLSDNLAKVASGIKMPGSK